MYAADAHRTFEHPVSQGSPMRGTTTYFNVQRKAAFELEDKMTLNTTTTGNLP